MTTKKGHQLKKINFIQTLMEVMTKNLLVSRERAAQEQKCESD